MRGTKTHVEDFYFLYLVLGNTISLVVFSVGLFEMTPGESSPGARIAHNLINNGKAIIE